MGKVGHYCARRANFGAILGCPDGYHQAVTRAVGQSKAESLCLPDNPTATACHTAYAKQAHLATPCTMTDGTPGMRHCGPDGLTECAP